MITSSTASQTTSVAPVDDESSNRRKILAVTLRYPPYVAGGYEYLTEDVVGALRERGHSVTVLTGEGQRLTNQPDILPWLKPGLDGDGDLFQQASSASNLERFQLHFLRLANLKATRKALVETGADALLFFNLGLVSLAPILAARCQGVPTLGYIADLWPLNHWVRDWQGNEARAETKNVRLTALAGAWRVFRGTLGLGRLLVPSQFVADQLEADGIGTGSLGVAPLGLSPVMSEQARNFEVSGRSENEPLRVICSSMMWSGKGQHVLLEACALAVSRGVDLSLMLAGSGDAEYVQQLNQLAEKPELVGRVKFGGMLNAQSLSDELSRSHVFALPSLWGEPFGLVTLEAMAHGVCPLVSDSGASPEIVRHERDGLVFESGRVESLAGALARLAANEGERVRLAESAQARVREHYDHGAFIDRVELELESTCLKGAL